MSFTKSLKTYFKKAFNSQTTVSLREQDSGFYSLLGRDYRFGTESRDFLAHAYGLNPYVFMVVDRIAQRIVQADKILSNKETQKEIEDPTFNELLTAPNERDDENSLFYRAIATYLATGEVFLVRDQELGERDKYFVPVNFNVIINEDTKGNVLSYRVTLFGDSKMYMTNEVLHIKRPDITFDTNRGFSPLHATRKVWESNNEVWASEAALHKNKGITGVLYSDGNRPMTSTEQGELQNKYDSDYTGSHNFGKVRVSTAKLGYIQMGMNPNDLKSIETRLDHLRTICASYNVDSKLFGDPSASTYNNMAEAQRAFIVNAVLPLSEILLPKLIGFMSKSVLKSYTMMIDENTIVELQITQDQKSVRILREVKEGVLTTQEAREMLYPELSNNGN